MITVKVTKSDIARAIKLTNANCTPYCTCPIALALKRTQKKKVVVYSAEDITIDERYYSVKDGQSKTVNNFINRFDSDENVKPIKFNIYTEKF